MVDCLCWLFPAPAELATLAGLETLEVLPAVQVWAAFSIVHLHDDSQEGSLKLFGTPLAGCLALFTGLA